MRNREHKCSPELIASRRILQEQKELTIKWLSDWNIVAFIQLEIKTASLDSAEEVLFNGNSEKSINIQSSFESAEDPVIQQIGNKFIELMPYAMQMYSCIKEDVCEYLFLYADASLAQRGFAP